MTKIAKFWFVERGFGFVISDEDRGKLHKKAMLFMITILQQDQFYQLHDKASIVTQGKNLFSVDEIRKEKWEQ